MNIKVHSYLYISVFSALFMIACGDDTATNNDTISDEINDSTSIDTSNIIAEEPIDTTAHLEELLDKDTTQLEEAQVVVQNLLEACAVSDFATASKYIAYMGADENRLYQDVFDYNDSSEKMVVDITAGLIKDWLAESEAYEFITYEEMDSEIGTVYIVEVMFNKQEIGINRKFFRLTKTDNGFLVIAMD